MRRGGIASTVTKTGTAWPAERNPPLGDRATIGGTAVLEVRLFRSAGVLSVLGGAGYQAERDPQPGRTVPARHSDGARGPDHDHHVSVFFGPSSSLLNEFLMITIGDHEHFHAESTRLLVIPSWTEDRHG